MNKFFIFLALVASPAYAEDPIIAKARAELETMKAANRANEAQVIANNEAIINNHKQEIAKIEKIYGPISKRPGPLLRTYVHNGRYIGGNTVVCVNGKCYQ